MPAPLTPASLDVVISAYNLAAASWAASVGADTYTLEVYNPTTTAWAALLSGIVATETDWVPPAAVRGLSGVKLRVKAVNVDGSSGWRESVEFVVPEFTGPAPVVEPGIETTLVTWASNGRDVEGEYWDGNLWRTLFAAQADEFYEWDTSKRKGAAVKVRLRAIAGLDVSSWVESSAFALTGKYSGNLWRALKSFSSLEVLYEMNDVSGDPADTSGNGRDATFSAINNYQQTSIITNRPNDKSVRRICIPPCGFGSAIAQTGGAWYSDLITLIMWMEQIDPYSGGSASAHLQLVNRGYIHGSNTGDPRNLRLLVNGYSSVDLGLWPAGPDHMLTMVMPPGVGARVVAYYDDVVKHSATYNTTAAVDHLRLISTEQREGYFQGAAAFSEELDALQVSWIKQVSVNPPNEPPSQPGPFTAPVSMQTYDNSVPVTFGASVDPEGGAVTYRLEYWDPNEETWNVISDDWDAATWDTSDIVQGDGFKLRVIALDEYEEESTPRESDPFNILHTHPGATKPTVDFVGAGATYIYFVASDFVSTHPGATVRRAHWRYATDQAMTNIIVSFVTEGPNCHVGVNPRDISAAGGIQLLGADVDVWADMRYEDNVGVLGARSTPVRGRSAKIHSPGARQIKMRDSSNNQRHGEYGIISGTDGSAVMNNGAGGSGFRFPGAYLRNAPTGAAGRYDDPDASEQLQGLVRVAANDPKSLGSAARADGLKRTLAYTAGNGEACIVPARAVYSITPEFGVLIRLFMPRALTYPNLRYGVCQLGGYLRIIMQNQRLWLEGYRGFYYGFDAGAPCGTNPYIQAFGYDWRPRGGVAIGTVPIGELYTLRLWTKSTDAYPDGQAVAAGEAGRTRIYNGLGLDSDIYLNLATIQTGFTWSEIRVGHCWPGTPNMADGTNTFPGAIVELAGWRHPEVRYDTPAKPWIADQTDAVTAVEVKNSPGLMFYYRLQDPDAPEEPDIFFVNSEA